MHSSRHRQRTVIM